MRDGLSAKQIKRAISPVSVADNTAQVSEIINVQGFNILTFLILLGALADVDATFTVLVEEGDESDLSDAAAVDDADLISQGSAAPETDAAFNFGDDNEVRSIGYRGSKQYVRLTITPVNNAGAALVAAVAVLEGAAQQPVTKATS